MDSAIRSLTELRLGSAENLGSAVGKSDAAQEANVQIQTPGASCYLEKRKRDIYTHTCIYTYIYIYFSCVFGVCFFFLFLFFLLSKNMHFLSAVLMF